MTIMERIEEIERELDDVQAHMAAIGRAAGKEMGAAPARRHYLALQDRRSALLAQLNEIDQAYTITLGGAA